MCFASDAAHCPRPAVAEPRHGGCPLDPPVSVLHVGGPAMSFHRRQEAPMLAQPSAAPLQNRFEDIQTPLLPPLQSPLPRLWGLGLFGLLLALLLPLLLLDPLPRPLAGLPAWQLRAAAALLLLGATGCLERHLISLQKHVRRQGHLGAYRRLKPLSRLPLLLATAGLAGLLAVVVGSAGHRRGSEWRGPAVRSIVGAEVLLIAAAVARYTALLLQLPQGVPAPDTASCLHSPLQSPLAPSVAPHVPAAGAASASQSVLDHQAELLRFHQERIHHLAAEVVRLQEGLATAGTRPPLAGGPTTQADLEYGLATREQELRTVAAERDVLAREVRGVRAVLAEAQAELARLRSASKQHVEENARLRAMRDEWSARSAKLEQTLLQVQRGTGST
ncbi:hypothetical protein KFL_008700050 [Klebsormidium nitens]|uniref:Uncharacterized protein n=1 Tax=Klebsormidium nitens TaxID=105231 RepID=A0A1Y1ILX6_KLENI|nr:hypothetical protein KFL_008700050 [Klebsormidium nitens]|eukprot:GAQ91860.1 hypothetical protein KFL_008700050 [Klebsormidium nitens]